MPDFSARSQDIEIMDDLNCEGEVVNQTLRELEIINRLLGGNDVTIDGLSKLINGKRQKIRIADLGCGSGEMLRLIYRWARKNSIEVELTGYDANPFIVQYAVDHTPNSYDIKFRATDIFSEEFSNEKFDVIIGTLFFHHFTNEQLSYFFRQIQSQASLGFIINDIHRHWLAYYSIKALTKVLSRSEMVRNDGPLSVLRAFSKKDLQVIMEKAMIENYSLRWMWAFRWQIVAFPS
jgi:2-polyprenyl-3-methyl-5-hydroxy-6-metoxy-1,4-benzoquinol methylase